MAEDVSSSMAHHEPDEETGDNPDALMFESARSEEDELVGSNEPDDPELTHEETERHRMT